MDRETLVKAIFVYSAKFTSVIIAGANFVFQPIVKNNRIWFFRLSSIPSSVFTTLYQLSMIDAFAFAGTTLRSAPRLEDFAADNTVLLFSLVGLVLVSAFTGTCFVSRLGWSYHLAFSTNNAYTLHFGFFEAFHKTSVGAVLAKCGFRAGKLPSACGTCRNGSFRNVVTFFRAELRKPLHVSFFKRFSACLTRQNMWHIEKIKRPLIAFRCGV